MRSELQDKVVVITGASSGIGRATAQRFAEHGAKLVVAARRAPPLDQAVRECVIRGGEATAVQVDVCNPESMENLARRAVESYGSVDIWINNAAVSLYARVDEGPLEVHRRVIETNLLGCLYGARLAFPEYCTCAARSRRRCQADRLTMPIAAPPTAGFGGHLRQGIKTRAAGRKIQPENRERTHAVDPSPCCCKPAGGEADPMARPRRPPPDNTKKESAAPWPPPRA